MQSFYFRAGMILMTSFNPGVCFTERKKIEIQKVK